MDPWAFINRVWHHPSKMRPIDVTWQPYESLWVNKLPDTYASYLTSTVAPILTYTPVGIKGILKVPRFYSAYRKEEEERICKLTQLEMQQLLLLTVYNHYVDNNCVMYKRYIDAWMQCTGAKNGGIDFIDKLLGREEGDTPIVIETYFCMLLLAADLFISTGQINFEQFNNWMLPFVDYVRGYKTSQFNNHHAWKAYFLLLAGHVLRHKTAFIEGAQTLHECIEIAIDEDGSFPMELSRGSRAASYSLMNLEALGQAISLCKLYNIRIPSSATETDSVEFTSTDPGGYTFDRMKSRKGADLDRSFEDYSIFLDTPEEWDSKHQTDSTRPDTIVDWDWVMKLQQLIYGYTSLNRATSFFGYKCPRAYSFLFPELRTA